MHEPTSPLGIAIYSATPMPECLDFENQTHERMVEHLCELGHHVSLFKPAAFEWQKHRLLQSPPFERIGFYEVRSKRTLMREFEESGRVDVIVSIGSLDRFDPHLEAVLVDFAAEGRLLVRWDLDAPRALDELLARPDHPMRSVLPLYDLVLAEGGGDRVVDAYSALGARRCRRVLPTVPDTAFAKAPEDDRFRADLALLSETADPAANAVKEYFLKAVASRPDRTFLGLGSGWEGFKAPANLKVIPDLITSEVPSLLRTPSAVLVLGDERADGYGYCPASIMLEAMAAGACVVTDDRVGIEDLFAPEREILRAHNGEEVVRILDWLTPERAQSVGAAARRRVFADHTLARRAEQISETLETLAKEHDPAAKSEIYRPRNGYWQYGYAGSIAGGRRLAAALGTTQETGGVGVAD